MFEARITQGSLLKKLVDALKELVTQGNFEAAEDGLNLQAMDSSHVCLVAMQLRSDGFEHFRCDRNVTLGIDLGNLAKLLKCAGNDDIITLKADDNPDYLTLMFEDPKQDRVADFSFKLMEIDSEHLGIPDTEYTANVSMPASDYARICKDLVTIGETVTISTNKEGVKFSTSGEVGTANITVRSTRDSDVPPEKQTSVELTEPVTLSFSGKYLTSFAKAAGLATQVRISMAKELPVVVEYTIADMGHLKFYLAPKIDDEDMEDGGGGGT